MQIGTVELNQPLALAPMEDVTDAAFRQVCKELGADLLYTEFANCEGLVRDVPGQLNKLRIYEHDRPIGAQLYGGNPESLERAARATECMGPDFIDVNCGCWVKRVVRREEGAALLKDLNRMRRVVEAVGRGTTLPVTVKTRLGWSADNIVILDAARMLEDLGVRMLAVHCRTRDQGHRGHADWSWVPRIKEVVGIPVIANGDVTTPADAAELFALGADGVMIGRGAVNNPWIFREIKHHRATGQLPPPPPMSERIALALRHLKLSVAERGERRGCTRFRKYYGGYLKGLPWVARLRREIMQYEAVAPIEDRLHRFAAELAGEDSATAC